MKRPAFCLPAARTLALAALLGAAALPSPAARAADLVVDGANGNSPYAFSTGTATYDNIAVGNTTTGTLNQSGGTLNVAAAGQLFVGSNAGSTGAYNLSGGTLNTTSSDIGDSGTGTFTLSGSAVHNVTGTDATANGSLDLGFYGGSRGTYNLNGGTFSAGYVRGNSGTSTFNFNGGTLTAVTSATDFFQNLSTANVRAGGAKIDTGVFNVTVAQNLVHDTASGAPATDGGLTKLGTGTLTLTGASTYTGATTVSAGTLAISGGGSVTSGSGASATLTVDSAAGAATAVFNLIGTNGSFSANVAFVGRSGSGTVNQTGGTLTTNGINVGTNANSSGTINLSGANSSFSTGDAYVGNYGSGTVNQSGGAFTTNGGTLYLGFGSSGSGAYNLSGGTLTTGTTQVSDDANTSTFTQTGGTHTTGTLRLSGYSADSVGFYTLAGGVLNVGRVVNSDSASGTSGASAFHFSGGTLQPSANNTGFFQGLSLADVRAGGAKVDTNGFNVTLAQDLLHDTSSSAADGGLTKLGAGTLTLGGNNAYTGTTTISAGTLQVGDGGTGGKLGVGGNVVNNAALIFKRSDNVTVANTISGTGRLATQGTGTLTLTGASTYTGTTTVIAGTLLAANASGSATGTGAVQVNSGATLGGSGTLAGALTVQSGATLAPGTLAPGSRLSLGSTLALQNGATLALTLGGTTAGAGGAGGYDQVLVAGRLTLGGNLGVRTANGFSLAAGQSFDILVQGGTAPVTGTFANAPGALYTDALGDTFLVNYAANADGGAVPNDVRLTVLTVVPEPATWAVVVGGFGGLFLLQRRRRRGLAQFPAGRFPG